VIKAIFLDFYGTVVHEDDEIISLICNRISENSKVSCTPQEIGTYWWQTFSGMFIESYGEKFETQRKLELNSLKATLNYFISDEDALELSQLMFDYWEKPPIFKDSKDFLNSLNIPIYILSNIDRSDLDKALAYHDINVEDIITSEDVKSYKPRPEMFKVALSKFKLNPSEVIHVGDSLSSDVKGAQQIGIPVAWINRKNKKLPENIKPDLVTNSLIELLDVI
jgi:2-haloalkanoic acid dehalogenase type II